MKLKHLITALSLGFAAVSASAAPLDSLGGNLKIKLDGLTTEKYTWEDTDETTWGVGSITQITSTTSGDIWQAGSSDGYYLYYMIYGIADDLVRPNTSNGFDIFNVGATGGAGDGLIHLDIYRTKTRISAIDGQLNANPANRTGYGSYSLLDTLGPAYLKYTFAPGVIEDDPTTGYDESRAALYQDTVGTSLPTSGSGVFLLNVSGGTAAAQWDTNGQPLGTDAAGNYTLRPNYGNMNNPNCSLADVTGDTPRCFAGQINDPIVTAKLPEPGSLALLGLGFAGLAGLRRRRAAK